MHKSEIKSKLTVRDLKSRYLINNLLLGINGALEIEEIKAENGVYNKLQAFKDDLLSIKSPILSEPNKIKEEGQKKAASIGSRAYILIIDYLDE